MIRDGAIPWWLALVIAGMALVAGLLLEPPAKAVTYCPKQEVFVNP